MTDNASKTNLTQKASNIAFWMIKELSPLKYAYKESIDGCFDDAIKHFGFEEPEEEKEVVVAEVTRILNEFSQRIY